MEMQRFLLGLVVSSALVACGGGGGGGGDDLASGSGTAPSQAPPQGPATPGVASPEGLWRGSSTDTFNAPRLLILESGEVWNVYGTGNAISGVLQGVTSWNGSSISSTVTDFNGRAGTISASILAGNYTFNGGALLNAMTLHEGSSVTLTTGFQGSNYEQPAKLSDIQGYWQALSWSKGSQLPTDVNVASNGDLTVVSLYCSGSGTVAPRPSGKNVFNLIISFVGGPNCEFNGQTMTGIAFVEPFASGAQLIFAGVQPDKLNAFVGNGIR